jgi:hypothetical protein
MAEDLWQATVTIRGLRRNHAKMLASELEARYVKEEDTVDDFFRTTVRAEQMGPTVR